MAAVLDKLTIGSKEAGIMSSDQDSRERDTGGHLQKNLIFLVLLGALFSLWIGLYTEWFMQVTGVWVIPSIIYGVWKLLSQGLRNHTREVLAERYERKVLARKWPLRKVLIVFLASISLATLFTSTIEVKSEADTQNRTITVYRGETGSRTIEETYAESGKSRKLLYRGTGPFRVKLARLPSLVVSPNPLIPYKLHSPRSFNRRHIVFVTPTPALTQLVSANRRFELVAQRIDVPSAGCSSIGQIIAARDSVRGRKDRAVGRPRSSGRMTRDRISFTPYEGKAVWLGTETDVEIPPWITNKDKDNDDDNWGAILPPLGAPEIDLRPGDQFEIDLRITDRSAAARVSYQKVRFCIVTHDKDSERFVQQVHLDLPRRTAP